MNTRLLLRVSAIRSQNPLGRGGCIFSGVPIDNSGNVQSAREYCVVRVSGSILGDAVVQVGQWWHVTGVAEPNQITVNGYRVTECQIEANDLELALPSGEHIITLMADSEDFRGIGRVKARRLWETFQERLYELLDQGEIAVLSQVLGEDVARHAIQAWRNYGDTKTLQWLQHHGFETGLGKKLVAFFGAETAEKIEADPYRLLSFCGSWRLTDALALNHFSLSEDDPRRLQGAIEEALYRLFDDGHTAVRLSTLTDRLKSILGTPSGSHRWRTLVLEAMQSGLSNGSYLVGVHTEHDIHPLGAYVMEMSVSKALAARITSPGPHSPLLPDERVEALIRAYEAETKLQLNTEQREAVFGAVTYPLMLITGGAGVGKTTVLQALYHAYDAAGVRVYQMALAGRAAKRLQEATGRTATTIASFLKHSSADHLIGPAVVVVDEASMVDIITMYRLCECLHDQVRLLLVGDPSQLMPVGPGLVLHTLVQEQAIPRVQLKLVKRHGGEIAGFAHALRSGQWKPAPDDESAPVAFLPCKEARQTIGNELTSPLTEIVLRLYLQNPLQTQILSPVKNGIGGVKELNERCQALLSSEAAPLLLWSDEQDSMVGTGFRVGDPLLCTRNLWDWGLQNGSLGRLVQIEAVPRPLFDNHGNPLGDAIAWVDWDDGERRPLLENMLDDLELGYAITVHKAQGSQWPRVIVPLTGHRILDRTLIYTAVTRAEQQVLLVGDEEAIRDAVQAPPWAHRREVGLGSILRHLLQNGKFSPEMPASRPLTQLLKVRDELKEKAGNQA